MKTFFGFVILLVFLFGSAVLAGVWVATALRAFNWALGS